MAKNVFSLKRILSKHITFHAVINALEAMHIEKVKHVQVTANLAKPCSILKQALTKSFKASDDFISNKLLSLPALEPYINPKTTNRTFIRNASLARKNHPLRLSPYLEKSSSKTYPHKFVSFWQLCRNYPLKICLTKPKALYKH